MYWVASMFRKRKDRDKQQDMQRTALPISHQNIHMINQPMTPALALYTCPAQHGYCALLCE